MKAEKRTVKISNYNIVSKNKKYTKVNNAITGLSVVKGIETVQTTKISKKIKVLIIEGLKLLLLFILITIMQDIFNGNGLNNLSKIIEVFGETDVNNIIIKIREILTIFFLNLLLSFLLYELLYAIINRKKLSLIITISLLFAYEVANYIVTNIRGVSITILDILSIRTALNVSEGLKVTYNIKLILGAGVYLAILALIIFLYKEKKGKFRILKIVVVFLGFFVIFNLNTIKEIPTWNVNYMYKDYGTNLTLVRLAKDLKVRKPINYNKSNIEAKLKAYTEECKSYIDTNVIIVMNESFADYTNSEILEVKEDNIPYFHSLQNENNVVTGIMHSDAFGGQTANIEYEFLTQNTIAFLPKGAMPYQQYIKHNIKSMVSKMNSLGYTTNAIHTWDSSGYNRKKVYELMKFDSYKFREDYQDLEYGPNGYTTDKSSYSKIIEQFENKKYEERIFSFNLTMQNHLPYTEKDEDSKIYTDDYYANVYLQQTNKSDDALKDLLQYFKNYNEKTIILFFGDHQPNMGFEDLKNDEENKYKVPYLIWANYDIKTKDYGDTSANFLQSILLEVAGLPKDEYTNYIIELREEIPVITANYYIGNNGKKYNLDDKTSPYYDKIQEYEKIVYYQIFDNK